MQRSVSIVSVCALSALVPGGFRRHEPEFTAPGVERAPGFEGR